MSTFPLNQPFLEALAWYVLDRHADDPMALARLHIILPNHEACRVLKQALREQWRGKALLLPNIEPLACCEAILQKHYPEQVNDHPLLSRRVMGESERLALVARQVHAFHRAQQRVQPGMEQALELAKELMHLFDQCERENVDLAQMDTLVPPSLHKHWRDTQRFLQIMTHHLPQQMTELGAVTRQQRELAAITLLAETWRQIPPGFPVIIAGSTGTVSATRDLLRVVSELPDGQVILPALATEMPQAIWEAMEPSHPQYPLKQLLSFMNVPRDRVEVIQTLPAIKDHVLADAFLHSCLPAAAIESMMPEKPSITLPCLEAANDIEEAKLAAALLRKACEDGHQSMALISPNAHLLSQVHLLLGRYHIDADYDVSSSVLDHPYVTLLYLTAQVAHQPGEAVSLLEWLHELAALTCDREALRKEIAYFEKAYLRGIRRDTASLEALHQKIRQDAQCEMIGHVLALLLPLERQNQQDEISVTDYFKTLCETVEQLVEEVRGGKPLPDIKAVIEQIAPAIVLFDDMDPMAFPALLRGCLESMKQPYETSASSRVYLRTPMQARLQSFDYVVLAGLNEESWPQVAASGAWMNETMRQALGMEPADTLIGTMAHDVLMFCASPQVVWTRSLRRQGSPAMPSRWWQRINTLCDNACDHMHSMLEIIRRYDTSAETVTPVLPQPFNPEHHTLDTLSVTGCELLYRDPYGFYAKDILRLKTLEPLDALPDHKTFGILLHEVMERFTECRNAAHPTEEALIEVGRKVFAGYTDRPSVMLLWWPRFMQMVPWLIALEQRAFAQQQTVLSEMKRERDMGDYLLHGRIDRVEVGEDYHACAIDYKTGSPPSVKEVKAGYACQLPLVALLLKEVDGFSVTDIAYWWLKGGIEQGREEQINKKWVEDELAELMERHKESLARRITAYNTRALPYYSIPIPDMRPAYNDYAHLARIDAWLYQ